MHRLLSMLRPGYRRSTRGAAVPVWLVLLAGTLQTVPAWGQDAPVEGGPVSATDEPRDTKERARQHFDRGVALYEAGDSGGALVEFEAAWSEFPTTPTLFNLANTERALFRYADAAGH